MKNRIEIPEDLAHLVEKRDKDRRALEAAKGKGADESSRKPPAERRRSRRRKS